MFVESLPQYYGLDAYEMFLALKAHFTSKYDFIKYNGKMQHVQIKFEGDSPTPEKIWATRLKTKYRKDLFLFLLANVSRTPKVFLRDLTLDESSHDTYISWLARRENIFNTFCTEMSQFCDEPDGILGSLLIREHKATPSIIIANRAGTVSDETLVILDSIFDIFDTFESALIHDPVWRNKVIHLRNYRSFFNVDNSRYQEHLSNLCNP